MSPRAGTYCIVETVVPSTELPPVPGDQLCVLLGFRTTDDNCVDTREADSERSQVRPVDSQYYHLVKPKS